MGVTSPLDDDDDEQHDAAEVQRSSVRYRARVLYDGTDFAGFQLQPDVDTIQRRLEGVLALRFQAKVRVVAASRTDAGVHARGQMIHFDAPRAEAPEKIQWAVNSMLPASVRVRELERAPDPPGPEFGKWHAIRCALGKLYTFRIVVGGLADVDPIEGRYRVLVNVRSRVHQPGAGAGGFDMEALRRAARHFVGTHDFSAFANTQMRTSTPGDRTGSRPPLDGRNPIRTIHSVHVVDEGEGRYRIDIHLRSALYKMVRNIVGVLLEVGRGRLDADDVPALLRGRDRAKLPPPAPACGLTLERVWFTDATPRLAGAPTQAPDKTHGEDLAGD